MALREYQSSLFRSVVVRAVVVGFLADDDTLPVEVDLNLATVGEADLYSVGGTAVAYFSHEADEQF